MQLQQQNNSNFISQNNSFQLNLNSKKNKNVSSIS